MRRAVAASLALIGGLVMSGSAQAGKVSMQDGTELHYEEKGTGRPMLIVPGWTMTSAFFRHQIDYFSKSYRVIAIDPRFQGESKATKGDRTYAQQGRDIGDVIDKLGLTDVVLVGWSFGCLGTLAYIDAKGTGKLSRYVCIDGSPRPATDATWDWGFPPDALRGMAAGNAAVDRSPHLAGLAAMVLGGGATDAQRKILADETAKADAKAAAALVEDAIQAKYEARLAATAEAVSSLFMLSGDPTAAPVTGGFDPNAWPRAAKKWLDAHPKLQVAPIKNHAAFWTDPVAFNEALERFLQSPP